VKVWLFLAVPEPAVADGAVRVTPTPTVTVGK
jgi:hypothetical protein